MKEHSLCQTVVGAPSGQGRYTLASGIPSSSKSAEKKPTLKHFVGLNFTSKNPTLPIFWLSACSAFICSNSSVTSLLLPRKNWSDFLAPSRSPLETRKIGDLGIQNIHSPRTAGKMIQIPENRRQSVLQFKLTKKMPRVTISCIHVPKAPRYLQTTKVQK